MLKTIILFTDLAHHHSALASLLREQNPGLSFCSGPEVTDLFLIEPELLQDSRLVCFGNTAVPKDLLRRIGHGAYRFYSVSLQYPGLAPTPNETKDEASCISVIAQSITDVPEAEAILGLETFTIPKGIAKARRDEIALARLAHLFWRMSYAIACEGPLKSISCSGYQAPLGASQHFGYLV